MIKLNKVRKIYGYEFSKILEQSTSESFVKDFKKTYYWERLATVINEEGFYVRCYPENKPRLRLTFPLFLISVLFLFLFGAIKWLFTGSANFDDNWWITRNIIAWDKYCRFNII